MAEIPPCWFNYRSAFLINMAGLPKKADDSRA